MRPAAVAAALALVLAWSPADTRAPRPAVVAIPSGPWGVAETDPRRQPAAPVIVSDAAYPSPVVAILRGSRDGSPRHVPMPALQPAHDARSGVASWFAAPDATAAAGPALRAFLGPSWRGQRVRVSAGGRSVVVRLTDWCLCVVGRSERLIDLSATAFSRLAPLSVGLMRVEVSVP